jgi:ATP-dependent Zn protease
MVREFGMSPVLGPVGFSSGSPMYLGTEEVRSRPYAEATQRVIDEEVAKLLRAADARASELLAGHRDALDRLVPHETRARGPAPGAPVGATGHTASGAEPGDPGRPAKP